jgi:hypothetical protein
MTEDSGPRTKWDYGANKKKPRDSLSPTLIGKTLGRRRYRPASPEPQPPCLKKGHFKKPSDLFRKAIEKYEEDKMYDLQAQAQLAAELEETVRRAEVEAEATEYDSTWA